GVGHQALHGHRLTPPLPRLGHELGDDLHHRDGRVEQAFPDELPGRRGHDGLGAGEHDVAGLGGGVAVGLEHRKLALVAQGDLTGGKQAAVDLSLDAGEQIVDGALVKGHGGQPTQWLKMVSRRRLQEGPCSTLRSPAWWAALCPYNRRAWEGSPTPRWPAP